MKNKKIQNVDAVRYCVGVDIIGQPVYVTHHIKR